MNKYDVRTCRCGRIHLVPWERIECAIHYQKEFLLVCGSCGLITAIGADYRSEGAYGFNEPCYDMYSYDVSKPFTTTPDMILPNGRHIAEIFFDRGIGVPMHSGEYATNYGPAGFYDDTYWYPTELDRPNLTAEDMHDMLSKHKIDRSVVDMTRFVSENDDETLRAVSSRLFYGLDWTGTPYDKWWKKTDYDKTHYFAD